MNNTNKNELVFDRVKADLTNGSWKGQYNASDLNRVEYWCRYLADKLNELGYSINITTKINWVSSDMRTDAEMERIRSNIQKLMTGFHWITKIYTYANTINYDRANRYEKILFEIYNMLAGMNNWYVYGGVANGGQPRLWQHRFRQFFKLPDIYTRLDYLESTGTQYIDTGFKHNQDTRFVADFEFSNVQNWTYPIGSFGGANGAGKLFTIQVNSGKILGTIYGNKNTNSNISANGRHKFDLNKNVHKIDNTTITYSTQTFTSNYNSLLFAVTNYTGGVSQQPTTIKLYSAQIYDNGTLVRNYIPVLRTIDNKPRTI